MSGGRTVVRTHNEIVLRSSQIKGRARLRPTFMR